MTRPRRATPTLLWVALGLLLTLTTAPRADAGWHSSLRTATDSGIDIALDSPFDRTPPEGFMPCWITIKNRTSSAHTWTIHAFSHVPFGNSNRTASTQSLRVDAESTARLPVLLPMEPTSYSASAYRSNAIEVEGYGVQQTAAGIPASGNAGKTPTAVVGLGSTLAIPLWEPLKKECADHGRDLAGSPVDATLLGPDWRSLSGLQCLWLTDAEYAALDAPRRAAIRRWIDQGGSFYLCTQTLDPAFRAALGLAETGNSASPGLGSVELIPWNGKELSQSTATTWIDMIPTHGRGEAANDATDWRMTRSLGAIPLNAPFLIGFILVFALLVGPVNLFWLANSTRRHRLFWTTPLISLAASLLLILVIILQDGFGGHGERVLFTLLCPDRKEALTIQEQIVRTGVLTSRRFTVAEDLVLSPLKVGRYTNLSFDQSGRSYSGDWFASRSLQAQRAEAIVPSRAEIQLVNADAATTGAAPVVLSSIPVSLKEFYYYDRNNQRWTGHALRTGEQITLQPGAGRAHTVGEHATVQAGSSYLAKLQEEVWQRPGYFYAVADEGQFIDTLPSIRWQKQQAVFAGPVTTTTTH